MCGYVTSQARDCFPVKPSRRCSFQKVINDGDCVGLISQLVEVRKCR